MPDTTAKSYRWQVVYDQRMQLRARRDVRLAMLYRDALSHPAPEPDPFTGEPVLHFGGHIWPVKGIWQRYSDRWNKLAEMVSGRCIVGVAVDNNSDVDSVESVKAALSSRFEVFTVRNTPEGENPSFRQLLTMMPTGNDDVFLYAHAKGMRQHVQSSKAVRRWVEVMEDTVLFNHNAIIDRLAAGFKCFGSLRCFGPYPLENRHKWHYAGTYFAVRSTHLPNCWPVVAKYGGVESWPGHNFPAHEAWCEFGDNRNMKTHYSDEHMCGSVMDEMLELWRASKTSLDAAAESCKV